MNKINIEFLIGRLLLFVSLGPAMALFVFTLFQLHLGFSEEIQKSIYQAIQLLFITSIVGGALMIANMDSSIKTERKTAV